MGDSESMTNLLGHMLVTGAPDSDTIQLAVHLLQVSTTARSPNVLVRAVVALLQDQLGSRIGELEPRATREARPPA